MKTNFLKDLPIARRAVFFPQAPSRAAPTGTRALRKERLFRKAR